MSKNKKIFLIAGFLALACLTCFSLAPNTALAAKLEIEYPKIAEITLTEKTQLPEYALYLFHAGILLGFAAIFISLLIAGVMYFLSPAKPDLQADAKDRVNGAISGLLILSLTYLIVTTINPQLAFFRLTPLPETKTEEPKEKPIPGVFLYTSDACSEAGVSPQTSSITDLGDKKNKVNSVRIEQDTENQNYYIAILYDKINLWGGCLYVDPTESCKMVTPFAASASIHTYDFSPNGDGVYFYRKPCFEDKIKLSNSELVSYCNKSAGGYLKIDNTTIKASGAYVEPLENLVFWDVPIEEQKCVKYDKKGVCVGREPQKLSGENISSIIINGDYLVLLVYFNDRYDSEMSWTSCQEFPGPNDVNKLGPKQVKWQSIRNNRAETSSKEYSVGGTPKENLGPVVPNYVVIIPVKS